MQFAVSDVAAFGRVIALPDDRDLIAALGQMTVEAVVGNVQGAVGEPFDVDMVIVEGGLLHRGERLDPVEALGLLAPEAVRVDDRLLVHGLVGRLVGQGIGQNLGTNGIQGSRTHLSYLGGIVVLVKCLALIKRARLASVTADISSPSVMVPCSFNDKSYAQAAEQYGF
ncbi:hypothetical protein D3C75_770840 [compost metagenome]